MALIKCPECGKEISDTCDSCIHCGYSLKKEHSFKNPLNSEYAVDEDGNVNLIQKSNSSGYGYLFALGIILFIFGFILLIIEFSMFNFSKSSGAYFFISIPIILIILSIVVIISFIRKDKRHDKVSKILCVYSKKIEKLIFKTYENKEIIIDPLDVLSIETDSTSTIVRYKQDGKTLTIMLPLSSDLLKIKNYLQHKQNVSF